MDNKTVFTLTLKGVGEIKNHTRHLPEAVKRALVLVDDESTVEELIRRAVPGLRGVLGGLLQELEHGGFIQNKARNAPRVAMPKMATPKTVTLEKHIPEEEGGDLDFTAIARAHVPETLPGMTIENDTRVQAESAEAEANARAEAEAWLIRAEQEAARAENEARIRSEQETAKVKAEAEVWAKQEADLARRKADEEIAKVRAEAEALRLRVGQEAAQARAELEAARMKAEEEAKARIEAEVKSKQEAVRREAEQEAARVRAEAEAGRIRAEQEVVRARMEAEAARIRSGQEAAKAKAEAEALAKQEAELARRNADEEIAKVRAEAEALRIKAEQDAAQARVELEAARMKAAEEASARAEAEIKAKQQAAQRETEQEAARVRAETEAARIREEMESSRAQAEAEAVRIRSEHKAEAEARVKQEADLARRQAEEAIARVRAEAQALRLKAEQETAQAKAELEAARMKAEAEASARAAEAAKAKQEAAQREAERMARAEAEAARMRAEQEAAKAKAEADAARIKSEQETARIKAEAEARAKQEADLARRKAEQEIARVRAEAEALRLKVEQETAEANTQMDGTKPDAAVRSMIATVLFFDVVGYTKLSVSRQIELKGQFNGLVSRLLRDIDENQRIILDTGDGAAIGFLQHPEHAIEVAMQFRQAICANKHGDYPELRVRIGIHLGPVNIVKDMNGQSNMVGDGINDAQRVMGFAPPDRIYISRSYYDVISRLTVEYAKLFQYRGVEVDKHGRQHQVYEVAEEQPIAAEQYVTQPEPVESAVQLEPFILDGIVTTSFPLPGIEAPVVPEIPVEEVREEIEEWANEAAELREQQLAEAACLQAKQEAERQQQEAERRSLEMASRQVEETRLQEDEAARKKMAEEQAQAWAEAERRAQEIAMQSEAEQESQRAASQTGKRAARSSRLALPWGRISGALFVFALLLAAALPYVWPTQDYIAQIEKKLTAQLHQPVHIGELRMALLPLPKLELREVTVGAGQELKAGIVVLNFSPGSLFTETWAIRSAEIDDLAASAKYFDEELSWLLAVAADAHYPVAQLVLRRAHINESGLDIPPVSGSADYDEHGHLANAELSSEDEKFKVAVQPQAAHWQVTLDIKENRVTPLPDVMFDELELKGEADENGITFRGMDGRLYGGTLSGNVRVDWKNGWLAQGRVTVKALDLHTMLPKFGIEGELNGKADFTMQGATLPQLADAPHLDGSFAVSKGTINKMDVVETARLSGLQGVSGGRTHFDELNGSLQADSNGLHLRPLRMSAGAMMKADGAVDVGASGRLSGQLNVDMKMREGLGNVLLALSGTLAEPLLRPVH
ncbi:MAG: hypothetical protein HY306_05885 [Nitrosomonadales bacterium]|nr:hypothetical protein [Nitrosomonadales bacterium]